MDAVLKSFGLKDFHLTFDMIFQGILQLR